MDTTQAYRILEVLKKYKIKSCKKLYSTWAGQGYATSDMLSEAIMDLHEETSDVSVALRSFLIVMRDS